MFIDTHAHINFNAFKNDADEIIRKSLNDNVWMILVGSEYKTSKRGLDIANKYQKGVYSAVGIHPIHLEESSIKDNEGEYNFSTRGEIFNYDMYEKLAKFEKVVAIGEIGLDYYYIKLSENTNLIKSKQKEIFLKQLELARNLNLPVIIHCRQAHDDLINALKVFKKNHKGNFPSDRPWGVIHCFSGDEDLAWQYFSLGLIISFTGIITFSSNWDNLIRKIPFEKFLIETDTPYLAPEPFRGKRNEPILVKYVAKRIAEIKHLTLEKVEKITFENAKILFNI